MVGGNQFPTFDAEFKFAKIQNSHVEGGGGGGGVGGNQFPTFDAEFKFAKIQNSHVEGGRKGGRVGGNQFPTFDAEFNLLKYKIPMFRVGGVGGTNFQLLMLSSNLLKSKIPMLRVGGWGGVGGNQFPTFNAEFKFAKIQKFPCQGGGGLVETNFQLLMLSPNLLKSKILMSRGGGVGGPNFQLLMLSPNWLKKNFVSFRVKKCLGMVLDFEYQVVRVYKVYANHNQLI